MAQKKKNTKQAGKKPAEKKKTTLSSMKQQTSKLHREMNLDCLRASLQLALELEFATIPPYLCALWSIKDDLHPAAQSIREVVQEEMLHMSLACNMLASIGGEPKISASVPRYPGPLPGGVHPGLEAKLSGLTKESLKDFMWIERPPHIIPHQHAYEDPASHANLETLKQEENAADDTIGEFYAAIKTAFLKLTPAMCPDHQISGPLAWSVIRNLDDMERAIDLITEQGEGSGHSPEDSSGDLSHFYRFLEVYEEVRLVWNPLTRELSTGKPLKFPETLPMAVVPKGGYQPKHLAGLPESLNDKVDYYLKEFDKAYTQLVDQLQSAWTLGGQGSLVKSYCTMFQLEKSAKPLMEIERPNMNGQTYGPCFRYNGDAK